MNENLLRKADLIIQNGTVVDPSQGLYARKDIAVVRGKVAAVEEKMIGWQCNDQINAEGCLVFPGLIDFHIHMFEGGTNFGVNPQNALFPCGVTSAVDPGTAGYLNYQSFSEGIVRRSPVTIRSMLNVCPIGLISVKSFLEPADPALYNIDELERCYDQYKDEIIALKTRISRPIVGDRGATVLEKTVEAGERLGLPVVVHVTNSALTPQEILERLRPGDIYCHVMHDTGHAAADENGELVPELLEARHRGVLFDAANGMGHFSFRVAYALLEKGFLPDIISSDITKASLYRAPAYSLPYIMSKYLNMGLTVEEVVLHSSVIPARLMGLGSSKGSLKTGYDADISIFRLETDRRVGFTDAKKQTIVGNKLLKPMMTVKDGEVVFRQYDFF